MMIPVQAQPEPEDFHRLVRQPGQVFLRNGKRTRVRDFSGHMYWRRVLKELHGSYEGICAYSCHWIPLDTGFSTVEHFRPREKYPHLAYEWSNYRLVCGALNGRKGNHTDVLDPFKIKAGWFVLDFPSLLIRAGPDLKPQTRTRVERTIARLQLNDDEVCVQMRYRWVMDYRNQLITWDALRRDAPFIAFELDRQGLRSSIAGLM